MLRVNCFIKVNDGRTDEVAAVAKELTEASLKDEGNVAYDVFASATRAGVLLICETWKDEESLRKHTETPHFKRCVGVIDRHAEMKIEQFRF